MVGGWRGCFGSLCCRNLPEMPIWIPKAESQRAEATGCPLGYCQMLWLLGTLPGRQSSYHDNPPSTSLRISSISPFLLSTKVFQGQANIALRTESPLPQERRQGSGGWKCVYVIPQTCISINAYVPTSGLKCVSLVVYQCMDQHASFKWLITVYLPICFPALLPSPLPLCWESHSSPSKGKVLSHGSS